VLVAALLEAQEQLAVAAMALGATGNSPFGCKEGCEILPTCQSCKKMRPPLWCTASVTRFQPSTCSGEWMPGVRG